MVAALKRGEVLSVMGDRLLGSDRNGLAVDFLGAPVRFPFSAYKLASATGAPIAVLLSRKLGPAAYAVELARVIEVPPGLGRGGEGFRPYVAELAALLEAYVEDNPYQFFNFFDMWDSRRRGHRSAREKASGSWRFLGRRGFPDEVREPKGIQSRRSQEGSRRTNEFSDSAQKSNQKSPGCRRHGGAAGGAGEFPLLREASARLRLLHLHRVVVVPACGQAERTPPQPGFKSL